MPLQQHVNFTFSLRQTNKWHRKSPYFTGHSSTSLNSVWRKWGGTLSWQKEKHLYLVEMNKKSFFSPLSVASILITVHNYEKRTVTGLAFSQPQHLFSSKSSKIRFECAIIFKKQMTISSEGLKHFFCINAWDKDFPLEVLALSIVFHVSLRFFQRVVVCVRFLSNFPASPSLLSL